MTDQQRLDMLHARLKRLRDAYQRDPNAWKESPLGPGYLTRAERWHNLIDEIERRIWAYR